MIVEERIDDILSHDVKNMGEHMRIDKWTDIDGWINRIDKQIDN